MVLYNKINRMCALQQLERTLYGLCTPLTLTVAIYPYMTFLIIADILFSAAWQADIWHNFVKELVV